MWPSRVGRGEKAERSEASSGRRAQRAEARRAGARARRPSAELCAFAVDAGVAADPGESKAGAAGAGQRRQALAELRPP